MPDTTKVAQIRLIRLPYTPNDADACGYCHVPSATYCEACQTPVDRRCWHIHQQDCEAAS